MSILLRIMVWNIYEGRRGPRIDNGLLDAVGENDGLPDIADGINAANPDIVLLNEAVIWRGFPFSNGINQLTNLLERTEMPHFQYVDCNWLGLKGVKVVAAFSKFPLGFLTVVPTWDGLQDVGFNTMRTSFEVDGRLHHLFSTRSQPIHTDKPAEEIEIAKRRSRMVLQNLTANVATIPEDQSVILGGDLNVAPGDPIFDDFRSGINLTHAGPQGGVDHVFFRGPYQVKSVDLGPERSSDHAPVIVDLISQPGYFWASYGQKLKLKHVRTGRYLHSHDIPYRHTGSSRQQQVTGFAGYDDNDYWKPLSPDPTPPHSQSGLPVRHGETIRLMHVATGRNLHSHAGFPSPYDSERQEVTCFGTNGTGDSNDNWVIEVEGAGTWDAGKRVRFRHVNTGRYLGSRVEFVNRSLTENQQAVSAADADDDSWWMLTEIR